MSDIAQNPTAEPQQPDETKTQEINPRHALLLGVVSFFVLSFIVAAYVTDGPDWIIHYRPAGLAFLQGQDIYHLEETYPNPPWVLLFIVPIAPLPLQIGRGFWFAMGLFGYGYAAYKLGARYLGLAAFLISPPVMHGLLNANIDWMVLLGAAIPAQWGLFMLIVKPQVGGFAALYTVWEKWRESGLPAVVKVLLPVTVVTLLSFLFWGLWPLDVANMGISRIDVRNDTLWPTSVPFGLIALVLAFRRKDITWAIAAGPLLIPYSSFHSYVALLMPFCKSQRAMIVAVAFFYVLMLWTAMVIGP